MNTIEHQDEPSTDDKLDAQRDIIRQSLDAIANDIGMAMRDVGLTFPVYITVRNSGDALVTIATPLDPSDADWQQASAIVCRIYRREGWLRSVARTRTPLRYCERRGDKCPRRDGRLILFNKFDRHRSPAVSIVPLRGCPGAASLGAASAKMYSTGGLTISK